MSTELLIIEHGTTEIEYRVRWKDDSSDDYSWETDRTLNKVRHLIKQYKRLT